MIRFPKALQPGATIGVVCPSSPIRLEQQEACVATLQEMGFQVKLADNLTKVYAGYMAGSGKERAESLNEMFTDPEVDAIFCARGGDASGRAVEFLDLDAVRNNPKPFVGYSDITTYHLIFNQMCGMGTYHGPMVKSNMIGEFDAESKCSFFDAVTAEEKYIFHNPKQAQIGVMHEGVADGIVTGGNLSLLCASMGTPYEVDTKGKILFIEEINEDLCRMDRMLWQLRNAGKLHACAGILLGQFTNCNNSANPDYTYMDCLREVLADVQIPVMYGLESGHGDKIITIPFGAECHMDTKQQEISFVMQRI